MTSTLLIITNLNYKHPKTSKMSQKLGLDWYSIHKLQASNFDFHKFSQIISSSQIAYGLDNVSLQFRKKLLILFQNASKIIKNQIPELAVQNHQLTIRKNLIAANIARKQHQLEASFQEISNMRIIYAEKKRLLGKLKEKIAKKQKKQEKKIYYCSFCQRDDFTNIESLKSHITSAHQNKGLQNRSQASNQVNQIKDLLMTMKDKQIQMMSMFLRASRQMQTQKLQKDYQTQYKKYMHVSGTKTDQSKQQELQELKGDSKFIFFPKSEQFRRQTQKQVQFRNNLKKQKDQNQQKLEKEFYNKQNYYNVFNNIEENVSDYVDPKKNAPKKTQQSNEGKSFTYYDPNEFLSKFLKNQSISKDSRFSLVQNTPKPYLQFKQQKFVEKQQVFVAPSISDRLRQINKKKIEKDPKIETMFSTKRKFYEESGYIFNSGPLVDDKGGESDYEDYFGSHITHSNQIEDEQIKAHPISSNKSYYPASKQSFHLSKLLSPKQSKSQISKSDKSSVIVDLSDSFSRRDFEISKDEDTINLSDLKFSKLEKKKEQERLRKLKEMDEKKSMVSESAGQNKSNSKQGPSGSENSKVSKQSFTLKDYMKQYYS